MAMIGLRKRPRDPMLPASAGEGGLTAPAPETVRAWLESEMLRPTAPRIASLEWEYARWKPGVSLTCTYAVRFEDDAREIVVAKRYSDGKDKLLSSRPLKGKHWDETSPRLLPRVALRDEATLLFTNVADRELKGTPYFLDRRKTAKILHTGGLAPAGTVRRRRLDYELLRYKPERRSVYRLGVKLRDEARTRFQLGCRLFPPAEAARIAERRRAFDEACAGAASRPNAPRLEAADARYGVLLERWLNVESFAPDSFEHAAVAGEALARLHRTPCALQELPARPFDPEPLRPLFRGAPHLFERIPVLTGTPAPAVAWCHGDFHPDQIAVDPEGAAWVLDLDLLAPGDVHTDLASWIADALVELPGLDLDEAASALLAGYSRGGGVSVSDPALRRLVAMELVNRAASAIRRLEKGAFQRAEHAVERARELAG